MKAEGFCENFELILFVSPQAAEKLFIFDYCEEPFQGHITEIIEKNSHRLEPGPFD